MSRITRHAPLAIIVFVGLFLLSATGIAGAFASLLQSQPGQIELECPRITLYTSDNFTSENVLADNDALDWGTLQLDGTTTSANVTLWAKNTDLTEDVHLGIVLNSIDEELTLEVATGVDGTPAGSLGWTAVSDNETLQLSDSNGFDPGDSFPLTLRLIVDPVLAEAGMSNLSIKFVGVTQTEDF